MTTPTPIFPQLINTPSVQILPATTNTLVTLYTGGVNGSIVESILVSSTDTSARLLQLSILTGAVSYILGTINIPLSSGTTGAAPAVNLISSTNTAIIPVNTDSNGNQYIYIGSGSVLQVNCTTTVTTAKIISLTAQGGDF